MPGQLMRAERIQGRRRSEMRLAEKRHGQQALRRSFFHYVSLNVLGMLGISCYILADTFFIARGVGPDGLAALNLAIPVFSVMNGIGLMLGLGGASRFAIYRAMGQRVLGRQNFTHTLSAAALFSLLFVLSAFFFDRELTWFVGANEAVFEMTRVYIRVILLFSPAFIMNAVIQAYVRNDGQPGLAMQGMLVGSLFNVLMDYILIFPCGLGMLGAVLATAASPLVGLLLMSGHFLKPVCSFGPERTAFNGRMLFDVVSTGIPALVTELSSALIMFLMNRIILKLSGNSGIAAYGIIANLAIVVMAIFNGIGQGMQPLVSEARGRAWFDIERRLIRYGFLGAISAAVLAYIGLNISALPVISAFNKEGDPEITAIALHAFRLYWLYLPPVAFNVVNILALSATERTRQAQLLSLLRGFLLIIPLLYLFSGLWEMTGVWLAFPLSESLVLGIGLYFLLRRKAPVLRLRL